MEIRIPDLPDDDLFPIVPPVFGQHSRSGSNTSSSNHPFFQPPSNSNPPAPPSQLSKPHPPPGDINSSSRGATHPLSNPTPPVASHDAPVELALYVLLDDFFARADAKMTLLLTKDSNAHLPLILGQGVDPAFDSSLQCLASVGRKLPKLAVDLTMRWRKTHSQNPRGNPERRSLASIHILCRALIAIVSALDRSTLQGDLGAKLEDIVFNSFKNAQPVHVNRSFDRRSNVKLYATLLSILANVRFVTISDRFLASLEPIERGLASREIVQSLVLRIRAIAHLPLLIYPIEDFEKSAEFVDGLSKVFEAASGAQLKVALSDAICTLLIQVARTATAEVNHPQWIRSIDSIFSRTLAIAAKPRYFAQVLPLIAVSLASAPQDLLLSKWQAAVEPCIARVKDKDKMLRQIAAHSLVLLLHAYLRRAHEPPAATQRRLEPIVRCLLPSTHSAFSSSLSSSSSQSSSAASSLTSSASSTLNAVRRGGNQQNHHQNSGTAAAYSFSNIDTIDLAAAVAVPHLITLRHFSQGSELVNSLLSLSNSAIVKTEDDLSSSLQPAKFLTGLQALLSTLDSLEFRRGDPILPRPVFLPNDVPWEQDGSNSNSSFSSSSGKLSNSGNDGGSDGDNSSSNMDEKSRYVHGMLSNETLSRQGIPTLIVDGQKAVIRALQMIDRCLNTQMDLFDERNLVTRIPDNSNNSSNINNSVGGSGGSGGNALSSQTSFGSSNEIHQSHQHSHHHQQDHHQYQYQQAYQDSSSSLSPNIYKSHGDFTVCYPRTRQGYYDVMALCFDSWPRLFMISENGFDLFPSCINNNTSNANHPAAASNNPAVAKAAADLESVLQILLRSILHVDPNVASSARAAFRRMVSVEHCPHVMLSVLLMKNLTRIISSPTFALYDNATYQTAATDQIEKLIKFWADCFASFCTLLLMPVSKVDAKMPDNSNENDGIGAGAGNHDNSVSAVGGGSSAFMPGTGAAVTNDLNTAMGDGAPPSLAAQAPPKRPKGGLAPGFVFGGTASSSHPTLQDSPTSTNPNDNNNNTATNNPISSGFGRPRTVLDELGVDVAREVLHIAQASSLVLLCYQSAGVRRGALSVLFHIDFVTQRCEQQQALLSRSQQQEQQLGDSVSTPYENKIVNTVIRCIGSFHDALDKIAQEDQQFAQLVSHLNGAERARLNMYRKPSLSKRHHTYSYNPKDDDIGWRDSSIAEANAPSPTFAALAQDKSLPSLSFASSASLSNNSKSSTSSAFVGPNRELLDLIRSSDPADYSLWHRLLPWTFRRVLDDLPDIAKSARYLLERTIGRLYHPATLLAGISPQSRMVTGSSAQHRFQQPFSVPDALVLSEHWKSHVAALCGLADEVVGVTTAVAIDNHNANSFPLRAMVASDAGSQYAPLNRGMDELFALVIPFLGSENPPLREAAIAGLATIHPNLYPALLEHLNVSLRTLADDRTNLLRERDREFAASRGTSVPAALSRKILKFGRLHASVSRVLELTSGLLIQQPDGPISPMHSTHAHLQTYLNDSFTFLRDLSLHQPPLPPAPQGQQGGGGGAGGSGGDGSGTMIPPLFDEASMTAWRKSFCSILTTFIASIASKQQQNLSQSSDKDGNDASTSTMTGGVTSATPTSDFGPLDKWLPTDYVHSVFQLLDQWCFRPITPGSAQGAAPTTILNTTSSATGTGRRSLSNSNSSSRHKRPSASHPGRGLSNSSMNSQFLAFDVFLPAARAMAVLCEHHMVKIATTPNNLSGEPAVEIHDILRWAQILLESNRTSAHECASRGIRSLISSHKSHNGFLEALVSQSFAEPDTLSLPQTTFGVLSPFLITKQVTSLVATSTIVALALWKLAHNDIGTRQRALDLIASTLPLTPSSVPKSVNNNSPQNVHAAFAALHSSYIGSSAAQHRRLSLLLSELYPSDARQVALDLTSRLVQLGGLHARQLLQLLPHWLSRVELFPKTANGATGNENDTDPIVMNLFLLTAKYGEGCHKEIVECWQSAVAASASFEPNGSLSSSADASTSTPPNERVFNAVIDWLVKETTRRGSREFIRHAQRVVVALTEPAVGSVGHILDHLASYIIPSGMLTADNGAFTSNFDTDNTSMEYLPMHNQSNNQMFQQQHQQHHPPYPQQQQQHVPQHQQSQRRPGLRRTTLDKAFQLLPRRSALSSAQASLLLALEAFITRLGVFLPIQYHHGKDGSMINEKSAATTAIIMHGLLLHVDHHINLLRNLSREGLLRILYLARHLSSWYRLGTSNDPNVYFLHDQLDASVGSGDHHHNHHGHHGHHPQSALSISFSAAKLDERSPTRWGVFWEHDEPSLLKASRPSGRAPLCMRPLIEDSLAFFENLVSDLALEWCKVALNWAISCPIRHMACRSFQAVRLLKNLPDNNQALAEITMRLSNTISDSSPDAQLFARETLFTLSDIVQAANLSDLSMAPQLLWTLVAGLESCNKLEFLEAVGTVNRVIQKLQDACNRQDPQYASVVKGLNSHRPQNLLDSYRFLSFVQLSGLRSNTTDMATWSFLRTLTSSSASSIGASAASIIVDTKSLLVCAYSAGLPWCLNAFEYAEGGVFGVGEVERFATDVARLADIECKPGISRLMTSMARGRFRSKDDFIRQSVANVKEYFTESQQLEFFVFLLGLLLNPRRWLRLRAVALLKAFLRIVDLNDSNLTASLGGDLLSPLLRLLNTDLAVDTISVLSERFPSLPISDQQPLPPATSRPGTASSANSGGIQNARARQKYAPHIDENGVVTETLTFGDVEADGWCNPVPQNGEFITRTSLRQVLDTFEAQDGTTHPSPPPVEFTTDDYPFPSSFDVQNAELKVQAEHEHAPDPSSLGDLVSQLHDLGDFFEKDSIQTSSAFRMSQMIGSASRVAAVLSRSLRSSSLEGPGSSSLSYRRNSRFSGNMSGSSGADISASSSEAINPSSLATVDEFDLESSSIETEWADDESHGGVSHDSRSTPSLHSNVQQQPPSPPIPSQGIVAESLRKPNQYLNQPSRSLQQPSQSLKAQPPISPVGSKETSSSHQQLFQAVRSLSPGHQALWQEGDASDLEENTGEFSTSSPAEAPLSPSGLATSFKPPFFRSKKAKASPRERETDFSFR